MMKFPLGKDGAEFVVIEPGNIQRLKDGKPLLVGNCMVAFTPDMQKFAELLGASGELPPKGEQHEYRVQLTPEQIEAALRTCQKLPEVLR